MEAPYGAACALPPDRGADMRVSMSKTGLALVALAAVGAGGVGIAAAAGGSTGAGGSRLDDGKQYLPKARVSEQQAIAAAQGAESGGLNEVDLEYHAGRLTW